MQKCLKNHMVINDSEKEAGDSIELKKHVKTNSLIASRLHVAFPFPVLPGIVTTGDS